MKLIKVLSDKIKDELHDAREYVNMAITYKEDYPELSRTLYTISTQEMEHVNMLHNEVSAIIQKWRAENGEPPADMLAVYNYQHQEQIEDSKEIKLLQALFREG